MIRERSLVAGAVACALFGVQAQPSHAQSTSTTSTSTDVPANAAAADQIQEVVVTGYRKSLQDSTNAKKAETGFSDAIFAEDIGKFPDTNVAESFNRIPGVQISRDADGSGVNVAIRGLGTDFTKVLLNGAPVAIASTGTIDAQNANREVDLNMFPTELFTQLDVKKSASASMIEGGASGTINMRSARPFDHEGAHLTYNLQGVDNTAAPWGERGSIVASDTWGPFGVLAGAVVVHNNVHTTGFETIGWTNANLNAAQCNNATTKNTCNTQGGGNYTIPSTVTYDQLLASNPGLSIAQINNGILPRLGRNMDEQGTKDRYNGVLSLEWRPTDSLHTYIDSQIGQEKNVLQRADMDWALRNNSVIPSNLQVDSPTCTSGCTVTSGTFSNSQFFLEYRPYVETTQFLGVNPGVDWQISDNWRADLRGNYTHSTFHREVPSVLVSTPSNVTVNYTNNGGVPVIGSSVDLDNPANFGWNGGSRVNIQDERRVTDTKGVHGDLTFGHGGPFNVSVGVAYDDVSRTIEALDNSQAWQNAVCGDSPTPQVGGPNTQPPCQGLSTTSPPLKSITLQPAKAATATTPATPAMYVVSGSYPYYPALGQGATAGLSGPIKYQGSLIPASSLNSYLSPGPGGFITVNWPPFAAQSQYAAFHGAEPATTSSNTGVSGGSIEEKTLGAYTEFSGNLNLDDHNLRYTAGIRWVRTDEIVGAAIAEVASQNNGLVASEGAAAGCDPTIGNVATCNSFYADGSLFPGSVELNNFTQTYYNVLPSFELAYNLSDDTVAKGAVSKTMTRPDPNALLPGINFSDPSAASGSFGNPNLKPYLSENLDLGLEHYMGGPSYVALTAFRKRITGFTANNTVTYTFGDLNALSNGAINLSTITPTQLQQLVNRAGGSTDPNVLNAETVTLTQQVNASGALIINGLEFDWVQSFDRLVDHLGWNFLDGAGFSFNYTLIDQHGQGAAPAVALGVSPHSYNLSLYYEKDWFSLRLSTVYNAGAQLSGFNQNGITNAAFFSDDYQQWDFSSYVDLGKFSNWAKGIQLTFDALNLTDAKQRAYFQFPNATFTEYNSGRSFLIGLRGKL